MKRLLKCMLFILIFCILYFALFQIFWLEKNPITYFYEEPNNSMDIVYIGGSNAYAHFNTTLAYNEYGFTTGMLAYDSQPFAAAEFLIKESEKYQKPKLYIVDLAKLAQPYSQITEPAIRKVTDSMKNSQNRINAINKLLSYTSTPKSDYINYYYSELTYHDAWKSPKSLLLNIFGNNKIYKGFVFSNDTIKKFPIDKENYGNQTMMLDKENIEALQSLIKYITDSRLNVLFVLPISTYEQDEYLKLNYGISMIKDSGFKVINFNDLEDFSVDYTNDFYDLHHLNVWGSTKYTLYLSKYLNDNYDLKDHRNDKKYESWNKEYERFKSDFNKLTGENFVIAKKD